MYVNLPGYYIYIYIIYICVCVYKTESRITLGIKTGKHLEILTSELMVLLGSTKKMIGKNKNGGNLPASISINPL